jgi:hypothetical protein
MQEVIPLSLSLSLSLSLLSFSLICLELHMICRLLASLVFQQMFRRVSENKDREVKYLVEASMLEIYNEKVTSNSFQWLNHSYHHYLIIIIINHQSLHYLCS